ncbi:MAG: PilZ domain-containing protein [Desulfomonile tiedjei]|nr:PilZ domain-containing protein [Desulfomonile tiedjei]
MAVVKISQKEILQDIRSGMDETAIQKKYNLSAKGVKSLYEKLIEAGLFGHKVDTVLRRLNIVNVLADIRGGMSRSELMKKYDLSAEMLKRVGKKLLEARGSRSVDDDPETIIEEPADFITTSEFVRHEVDLEIPVYDAARPEVQGTVRDISEEGVSIAGLEANVGDAKTLVILADEFGQFAAFEFEGYCRWCFTDPDEGTSLTGFAITRISDEDLGELRKLVRIITTGG